MEMTNFRGKQKHKLLLKQSYEEVGTRTWLKSDFQLEQLETSRNLFENHSLSVKSPIPKTLSVFALLSGQPFEKKVTDILTQTQEGISNILGDKCHYFVKPNNFGLSTAYSNGQMVLGKQVGMKKSKILSKKFQKNHSSSKSMDYKLIQMVV